MVAWEPKGPHAHRFKSRGLMIGRSFTQRYSSLMPHSKSFMKRHHPSPDRLGMQNTPKNVMFQIGVLVSGELCILDDTDVLEGASGRLTADYYC